nr:sorting nexin-24 isoform X4 [Pan troglodytes]
MQKDWCNLENSQKRGVLDNIALSGVRELFSSFDTMWKEHFLQTYNLRPMILAHKQLLSVLHLGESKHIHTHGWREGQRDGRMNALVDGKTLRVIRYFDSISLYSKAVILENEELPKLFLDFLNVRHLPSLPKAESCGSFDETESEESSKLSHQPVLLFLRDPYVLPAASGNQTCHLLTALY